MPHWTKILIHDAVDNKGLFRTSNEILAYHTGWKDIEAGEPLSEGIATHLIEQGQSGISRPWKECGDHWHIEFDARGQWVIKMMRPMTSNGSHAREGNLNRNAISIRIIQAVEQANEIWYGNPDVDELYNTLAKLCKFLMKLYKIPASAVLAHHEITPDSNCPSVHCEFKIEEVRKRLD